MTNDHLTPPARARRTIRTFDLSPVTLIATALAAVVATFAASYLGVAGTVVGAALFSVVTAVGKEVFGQSLRRTGSKVRESAPITRVLPRIAVTTDGTDAPADTAAPDDPEAPPELPAPAVRLRPAPLWRRVALVSVIVFIGVLASVTAVEVFAGRPVSDLVRGEAGKGTSLFGGQQVVTQTVPPTTPTVTVTVTPKVVVTTPTQTQTAPTVTESTTPTASSSAATGTSAAPSASGTPSQSPSATVTTAPRP